MKLLVLELCLLSLVSHGQLQVSMPTIAPASTLKAEIEKLRNFLDEALKTIDSGNGVAFDQDMLLSYLTQYTQSLMVKHVSEQETAATTEASITENNSSAPSLDVNSDNTNNDVIENEETTSPVYSTTATQEQSTRDESEYATLGILQGMSSPVYSTTATQEQSTRDKICELPATTGLCRGYFVKFYFDPTTGLCTKFVYGGCGGNANRFNSEEDCKKRCYP